MSLNLSFCKAVKMGKIIGPKRPGIKYCAITKNKLFCLKEFETVVKVKKINNVASKNMVENIFSLFKIYTT